MSAMGVGHLCVIVAAAGRLTVIHGTVCDGVTFSEVRRCCRERLTGAARSRGRVTAPSAVLLRSYARAILAMEDLAMELGQQQVEFAQAEPAAHVGTRPVPT